MRNTSRLLLLPMLIPGNDALLFNCFVPVRARKARCPVFPRARPYGTIRLVAQLPFLVPAEKDASGIRLQEGRLLEDMRRGHATVACREGGALSPGADTGEEGRAVAESYASGCAGVEPRSPPRRAAPGAIHLSAAAKHAGRPQTWERQLKIAGHPVRASR